MMANDPEASRTQDLLSDVPANVDGNAAEDLGVLENLYQRLGMSTLRVVFQFDFP